MFRLYLLYKLTLLFTPSKSVLKWLRYCRNCLMVCPGIAGGHLGRAPPESTKGEKTKSLKTPTKYTRREWTKSLKGCVRVIQFRGNSCNIYTETLEFGQFNRSDPKYLGKNGYVSFWRQSYILRDTPDIIVNPLYLIIKLCRILLFPWNLAFRICVIKSLFVYKYWLEHCFSVKNDR